ncbi:MAG: hypothetical protein JST48_05860 [Bacteroidetes bacterium]|nr:hypothetical protein [Bacteroidota bacterium]
MKRKILLSICLLPCLAFSQKLENLKAVAEGDKVIITYDLAEGGLSGDKFDVKLFASHNNFSLPLQIVSGYVGNDLMPGKTKKIVWNGFTELNNYHGDLTFEVRAEVKAAFTLKHNVAKAKRGRSIPLDWRGGSLRDDVKIELLKSGVEVGAIATASNNGSFTWEISSYQKVGSGFQLRFTNGKEVATSEFFRIKRKVPTFLKVIPFLAAGVVVGLGGGGGSKSGSSSSVSNLAGPPDLGLN